MSNNSTKYKKVINRSRKLEVEIKEENAPTISYNFSISKGKPNKIVLNVIYT